MADEASPGEGATVDDSTMPRLGPDSDIAEFCTSWVSSVALRDLVAGFGGEMPTARSASDVFAWLESFSTIWDFRRRKERNEAQVPDFDDDVRTLVDRTTRELGLQDTLPATRSRYDHVLILGGLARGCIARPLHAAALIDNGMLTARQVTALGGFRPLNEAERPLLDSMGFEGRGSEFDAMEFGVRRAFRLDDPVETSGDGSVDDWARWRVHRYRRDDGLAIEVAAAPAPEAGRRANTGDTYEWLATSHATFSPGESLLIVTTLHYRLYQLAEAIRLLGLPHRLAIDAVGMAPGDVDERLAWMPSTGALLQETRSSIRSLRRLYEEVGPR